VVEHVDKPAQTNLEWLWGIACWGSHFAELMHVMLAGLHNAGREAVLGDVFDAALEQGLQVRGLPFAEGRYTDIGTYNDLKQALERYT
jgi:NDP-sugar pyrophosphorylase family protein